MKTTELGVATVSGLRCIHEGRNCRLYLQSDGTGGGPVVIKTVREDRAGPEQSARLANEFNLGTKLKLPGVRRACASVLIDGRPAVVLEFVDGATLRESFVRERRPLAENLEIAVAVAAALEGAHRSNLIHRNLSSDHILVSASSPRTVSLIDLGGASLMSGKGVRADPADLSESALAYVSPEQTGRTNRLVDRRADLYSLGAALYEVFTGRIPFQADDPAELIHCHLAQSPVPPRDLQAEVPAPVSEIIMRLLAKNPDDRYQSAFGLQVDLENCLMQLRQHGRIETFPLGSADYRGTFQLPGRLYGRDEALRELKDAVQESVRGRGGVVLVSGPAGAGKTTLVECIQNDVTTGGGLFIKGGYGGSRRHVPYAGLIHAFGELLDLILTESSGQLEQWKARILEAVGGNGRLLVETLPRLELVIGPQPPVPELGLEETQHRFLHLLGRFICALGRRERPLVLFLDNLQWADQASGRVLERLLPELDQQPIVFIGAFREDELGAEQPITPVIEALKPLKTLTRLIALGNLTLDAVNQLIADALKAELTYTLPLARLVLEKTGGNALLVTQFLEAIHDYGLLRFDLASRRWTWDANGIRRREVADTVARLMTQKIEKLPDETKSLLSLAACVGGHFTLGGLAAAAGLPVATVAARLCAALDEGMLQPVGGNLPGGGGALGPEPDATLRYEFSHERVRHAAYTRLPRKEARTTHLRLGRLLLQQTPAGAREENVFEIADQLNEGFQLLTTDEERWQLAELNLMAGRRAKWAAAHRMAIRYLSMGIGVLPANRWEGRRELTRDLFVEAIEAEHLSTNFERAATLSKEVLAHVQDRFVRVRVHELRILIYTAQNQVAKAIEAGRDALTELGVAWPAAPDETAAAAGEWQRQLAEIAGRPDDLAQLPAMSDPRYLAAMRILMQLTGTAYRMSPGLLKAIILRMVLLSVQHGNSPMAAVAYAWHGALLCSDAAGIEAGYRFGRLSLEVLRRFPAPELEMKVLLLFNTQVRPWKEDIRECVAPCIDVYRRGLETGDLDCAWQGALNQCGTLFHTGAPLQPLQRKQLEYLEAVERSRLAFHSQSLRISMQTVANLSAGAGDPCRLIGEYFDESSMLPGWLEEKNSLLLFSTLLNRMMLQYLFGDYAGAAESGRLAEEHANAIQGLFHRAIHAFYYALALLAVPATTTAAAPWIGLLGRWAAQAPMNFAHKLALLEAERARRSGETGAAVECFGRAIRLARESGCLQDEALAYELEAGFYRALGREDIAGVSLRKAAAAYRTWGAFRKADDLERRLNPDAGAVLTSLDTAAVVKASHTLSREVRLEHLLEKLMTIVLENAGAQKGVLIQTAGAELVIQACAEAGRDRVETMQAEPVEGSGAVPVSVINYVARTQSQVVLGDAQCDRTYGSDRYIVAHQTRSLLCLPIVYHGKLSGLLYLENNLAADVFTADRLELLNALASQAAISMENAGLYADLEHKVVALQQAEAELRRYRDYLEEQVEARTAELTRSNRQLVQEVAGRVKIQDALQRAHDELEQRVSERTAELRAANERLQTEVEQRKRTEDALRQSEQKVRAVLNQSIQFVGLLTTDGTVLETNESALRFAGVSEADVHGKPFWDTPWWTHSPELQQRLRAAIAEAAAGKLVRFEASHIARDGEVRFVDFSIKPLIDEQGRVTLLIPEGSDITERKNAEAEIRRLNEGLEARVRERTAQLEAANKELETFSYSVSHDLRSPLRIIDGFSRVLLEDYADKLDAEGRENLQTIRAASQKMAGLIDDMLRLASLNRSELRSIEVDLSRMAGEIAADLRATDPERGAEFIIAPDCRVTGDPSMLRVAMENILGNAWKYTGKKPKAVIEFGVKEDPGGRIFFVRDNGCGFEMKYVDRLFVPFHRLHATADFPGTGIGLASVQRVIQRHGGRVWIEGEVGEGATLSFTLPKRG